MEKTSFLPDRSPIVINEKEPVSGVPTELRPKPSHGWLRTMVLPLGVAHQDQKAPQRCAKDRGDPGRSV